LVLKIGLTIHRGKWDWKKSSLLGCSRPSIYAAVDQRLRVVIVDDVHDVAGTWQTSDHATASGVDEPPGRD